MPRGVDMILHNLSTGRDQLLGSVGDAAFNKAGDLLAYTVDSAVRDGNGLFVLDLSNGSTTALENDAKSYNRLTWNDAGTGLAVLKGSEVDKMRERANVLVVYRGLAAGHPAPTVTILDPAKAAGFPANWVVSDRATLRLERRRQPRVFRDERPGRGAGRQRAEELPTKSPASTCGTRRTSGFNRCR